MLKHIEGDVWRELIRDEDRLRERFDVTDVLEWHLRVFVQVCQAVRFAHSRGIIHRDIKPSNVMVGAYDDVYLLDWGLALSLGESDRIRSVKTTLGVAGTPGYMAPEQFARKPTALGVGTDVYLLGATLFDIVARQPPQGGRSLDDICSRVQQRQRVAVPASCPRELDMIIQRAMAVSIDARYASVSELLAAVEAFIEHQGSHRLAAVGDRRGQIMIDAYSRGDTDAAEQAFIEASFSYRMAIDSYPDNVHAGRGLRRLVKIQHATLAENGGAARRAAGDGTLGRAPVVFAERGPQRGRDAFGGSSAPCEVGARR